MSLTNIFIDGQLMEVHVSRWSGGKALKPEDLGLRIEETSKAYRLGRKMLVPDGVIQKFTKIESRARFLIEKNSFNFPVGHARFVPKKKFPEVLAELKKLQAEYDNLVDDLIENYEKYRSEMIPLYQEAAKTAFEKQHELTDKDQFIERFMERINSYYPPAKSLRYKFGLRWDVYEISMPRMEEADANEVSDKLIYQQEIASEARQQMSTRIKEFVDDVVQTLRSETIELCERITQNIKEGRVVKSKSVGTLKKFIERFSDLNFVGDETVEEQLQALKKEFLTVYPVKKIGESESLQTELSRRIAIIKEAAENVTDINSVTGQYRRKIKWSS